MPNNYIYVFEAGERDYSRWLNLTMRPGNSCMVHLTDLCHPGRLSGLSAFTCDLNSLATAVERGALQITLPKGYTVFRRDEDLVQIEFRSHDDDQPTRVGVCASELRTRLEELQAQATAQRVRVAADSSRA